MWVPRSVRIRMWRRLISHAMSELWCVNIGASEDTQPAAVGQILGDKFGGEISPFPHIDGGGAEA
jgi:hypothetical protein